MHTMLSCAVCVWLRSMWGCMHVMCVGTGRESSDYHVPQLSCSEQDQHFLYVWPPHFSPCGRALHLWILAVSELPQCCLAYYCAGKY